MNLQWDIQFYSQRSVTPSLVNSLFYLLVSNQVKYGVSESGQRYSIRRTGSSSDDDIEVIRPEAGEATERLGEIVCQYIDRGVESNVVTVYLDTVAPEAHFWVSVFPGIDEREGHILKFGTHTSDIRNKAAFEKLINLCREVFETFDYEYGAFRSEHDATIPRDYYEISEEQPNRVNFYSDHLATEIGREKILSAPAKTIEELANGGIMVVVQPIHAEIDLFEERDWETEMKEHMKD